MKTMTTVLALALVSSTPALAKVPVNPQIDYQSFTGLVSDLAKVREKHRLAWPEFAKRARADGAVLLDARSPAAFARGHLDGAVNLPFSDFTAEALAEVIGPDAKRPIYIYCNNNFRDNRAPVVTKAAPLALNIPTFINLHGYGYGNVWELADVIGMDDPAVGWVGTGAPHAR
ncbi:MAG: rhodanese-like domain-containing protein [Novosphingobium sp.]